MPKIKDLFKKHDSSGKVLSAKNINELTSSQDAESLGQIQAYQIEKDRFFPEVDFSKPETFARYGSAEKYYENAITAIYRIYPYDGSLKEKMEWHNSASYFDNYVFDNLYPRTNGYLNFGPDTTPAGMTGFNSGIDGYRKSGTPQYVYIKGGPNKAGLADNQDSSLQDKFFTKSSKTSYTQTSANIYDAKRKRASNFAMDGVEGNTIEMWIKPRSPASSPINKFSACHFDLWNSDGTVHTAIGSASYGRIMLETRTRTTDLQLFDGANFHLTYMSGTSGAERVPLMLGTSVSLSYNNWSHIAFSVKNVSSKLRIKSYFNGVLIDNILTGSSISEVTGALNANLGAFRHFPTVGVKASALAAGVSATDFVGANSVSGSIDEFRFWKTGRSSKDIGRNWFTQVHGGTNTDSANADLGVYFKFNEGITGNKSFDSNVLDYSGRISNGKIQNYATTMRSTGSAIVESTASAAEFKDPIIYSFHPQVEALLANKKEEGSVYDARNTSAMHTTIPTWMGEEDKEVGASNLQKLMQIMASYFDTLQLQLEFLPRMKDADYTKFFELRAKNYSDFGTAMGVDSNYEPAFSSSYSGKPQPFTKFALQSLGMEVPEIFTDANALEQFRSRDSHREYKDKLYNIKNQIYQNVYNNLHFILKSKGTEKAFRNLIRCYGIDDELVRLNLYGNNVDFELKNNFRSTAVKRTYVDFVDVDRHNATVYMMTSSDSNNTAYSYIPSNSALVSGGFGMTFQSEVYFSDKGDEGDAFFQPFEQLTSSLFGVHTAVEAAAGSTGQANTTWNNPDVSEFKVYAVRPEKYSPHAYFQLTSSVLGINLQSKIFDFVYDNEKWNFAVRIKPTKYPWANALTGTNSGTLASGVAAETDLTYDISFYGAHADLDVIVDEFDLSTSVNASLGDNFMSGSKRVYIGAHRTNFTGTTLQESDVRISSTRAWMDYLTNDELKAHARDADNKGVLHPYRNAFVFQNAVKPYDIPRSDLLIFEWDFTNVTGSDAGISGVSTTYDARFVVEDISSGSTTQNFATWITDLRYAGLRNIVRNQFTGRGDFFEPNNPEVVDHIYIHSAKQDAPEVINSSDMIEILNQDDLEFTRESRPIDYFYAVEKSMYQTISDEMLRMFATIADFNNLIGEPVNRYRGHYKDMDKLKSLFFESIGNSPDLDKYVDFYKWIDASITKFLEQLFPASANYSEDLRTVVESHVLERNAYRNKFPTLEIKQQDPEVPILGINELTYNWKFGHAPTDVSLDEAQQNKCLWFNQRAERSLPALRSGVASVDADKQTILDRAVTDNSGSYLDRYEGSTYVLRKLSKPYKEGVSFSKQIKGGVNFSPNKKKNFWKDLLKKNSNNGLFVTGSSVIIDDPKEDRNCTDADDSQIKYKAKSIVRLDDDNDGNTFTVPPYHEHKGNLLLPFNIYSTASLDSNGIGTYPLNAFESLSPSQAKVVITNLHDDSYGTLSEIPMQGPFAEKYEGGNQHRHYRLNDGTDTITNRPEAFRLNPVGVGGISVIAPGNAIVASYQRDFVAKRPVVIKNILQTTASVDVRLDGTIAHGSIGNYSHQHDVVQTSGRKANNKYFVEQVGVGFGHVITGLEASPEISSVMNKFYDFEIRNRKTTDTVFVERFSAPGSYEAMSRGYLDPFAEEMSVYNAMPFRNLSVRGFGAHKKQVQTLGVEISASIWSTSSLGLNSLLSRHTLFGGYDHKEATIPAFHKTYRNRLRRIQQNNPNNASSPVTTGSVFDNAFVSHMIPRSDFQYSWITASILSTDMSNAFGFGYFPYSGEVSSSAGGFESAVNFVSASEHGSYILNSNGNRYYGINKYSPGLDGATRYGFIPVDFVGLNTNFYNNYNSSTNTITATNRNTAFVFDYAALNTAGGRIGPPAKLNALNLRRGGAYGYPTFKQIRNMYHPIARHLKDTNTYSISVRNGKQPISKGGFPYENFEKVFPKLCIKGVTGEASYENLQGMNHALVGSETTIENYIEPPLSSKFMPMRHALIVNTPNNETADLKIDHTYANNYDFFANPTLMNKMNSADKIKNPIQQVYDNLLEYTVKGTIKAENNPIKGFKHVIYKETIYPKERHTYLGKSRGRTLYGEDLTSENYNSNLVSERVFWRDIGTDRQRLVTNARTIFNKPIINTTPAIGAAYGALPLPLSIWGLDVGDRIPLGSRAFSSLTGSNHGELSIPLFQQSMTQYLRNKASGYFPTASFAYEYHNFISSSDSGVINLMTTFIPNWDTAKLSEKNPWFDSYEEYAEDIRLIGQEYTVLPEFRISEHMDYYLENGFFGENAKNNKFLTIEGGYLSQSAKTETSAFDSEFFNIYSHSDFLKHFEVIREQHEEVLSQTRITIKCKAVKKLLPYNGFYPMTRTIQLGNLMSESFGPFLNGSTIGGNGEERIASFIQPYFNPGILYNTIKSGLAVDWLGCAGGSSLVAQSGSSGSRIGDSKNGLYKGDVIFLETGSFRFPFESVINPQNYFPSEAPGLSRADQAQRRVRFLDTMQFSGSSTQTSPQVSGAFVTWNGENKPNYSLAMNNFLSEIPNFFLSNGKCTSIESSAVASFASGVTYFMDLDIYKTNNMVMYEGPSSLSASKGEGSFGTNRQARGIHYGPAISFDSAKNGTDRFDPAYAPYTPPYFYGKASARFEFKPHEFSDLLEGETLEVGSADSSFKMSEIVSYIAVSGTSFYNNFSLDDSEFLENGVIDTSLKTIINNTRPDANATKFQMQAYSSMNLFKVVEKSDEVTDQPRGRWIISPKFECPILNFANNAGTTFQNSNLHTRGMWRGYGEFPTPEQGIFYNIRESQLAVSPAQAVGDPLGGATRSSTTTESLGSLREKLFASSQPTRIGEIADQKEIFEAVVAIPFKVSGDQKVFIPLVPASDPLTASQKGREVVDGILGTSAGLPESEYSPGFTIVEQIQKMQKYVFPPALDFINNKNISPFQMYIFEFNHVLSKQDLADIWQGVMPKISRVADEQTSAISHYLTYNELLNGKPITSDLRWMVFKVKQRAHYNYDKLIETTLGGPSFEPDVPVGSKAEHYSYNWPYDFFSLVELTKIDTAVQLGGSVPVTPPSIFEPSNVPVKKTPKETGVPRSDGDTPTLSEVAKEFLHDRDTTVGNRGGDDRDLTPDKMSILNNILNSEE